MRHIVVTRKTDAIINQIAGRYMSNRRKKQTAVTRTTNISGSNRSQCRFWASLMEALRAVVSQQGVGQTGCFFVVVVPQVGQAAVDSTLGRQEIIAAGLQFQF